MISFSTLKIGFQWHRVLLAKSFSETFTKVLNYRLQTNCVNEKLHEEKRESNQNVIRNNEVVNFGKIETNHILKPNFKF